MRRLPFHPLRFLLAAGLLLAGCATYQFDRPATNWQTLVGQLQYASPKRSIIGETVVSRFGENELQLDFAAGPVPILRLRKDGERGRAEASFARVSWQGNADHPPGPLKSWFALHEVFADAAMQRHAADATVALHSEKPGFWDAKVAFSNGKPVDVQVNFPHSKERFHFHFGN
jgi:hypothetical protein